MPKQKDWSTPLHGFWMQPGGVPLCLKACCCPCLMVGDLSEENQPGSWATGCCGCVVVGICCGIGQPICYMQEAPKLATKQGFVENGMKSFCCSGCPCTAVCYMTQVGREILLRQKKGGEKKGLVPKQEKMDGGSDDD